MDEITELIAAAERFAMLTYLQANVETLVNAKVHRDQIATRIREKLDGKPVELESRCSGY